MQARVNILPLIPKGKDNRITAAEIKRITNQKDSVTRQMVHTLRENFIPIASDSKGYFIAEKPEELNHTIAQINSRIHQMIRAKEALKKAQRLMEEDNNV